MDPKMPCRISDGPQTPEDAAESWDRWFGQEDEDDAYERHRQHEIDTTDRCPECKGHGADPLSDNVNWLPCKTCGGDGRVAKATRGDRNE